MYGRKFILNTDHKPLLTIFIPNKGISAGTANRLQRWSLILLSYDFEIHYKRTLEFGETDALSRLIAKKQAGEETSFDKIIAAVETDISDETEKCISIFPTTVKKIQEKTRKDPLLQQVTKNTLSGKWPIIPKENELYPSFARRDQLGITSSTLTIKNRTVIPNELQKGILKTLHNGHPGIQGMKALARSYVY